uniref:Putative saposin-related protein n=1 Tax=Ixodes ricinus TaxID=34613 RepID=A0A6B0U4W0_IXORI
MVNTYLDIIVSLLIQQTTPTELCQIVGFCPNCKFGFSSYWGSFCPNWSKFSGASVGEGAYGGETLGFHPYSFSPQEP